MNLSALRAERAAASRAAGMSENTVLAADSDLKLLIAWLAARGVEDSAGVTPEHLVEWFREQREQRHAITVRRRQWTVEAFLRWAAGHFRPGLAGSVPTHPCPPARRRGAAPKDVLINRMVESALERGGRSAARAAAVVVLARMGLRAEEIAALDVGDVSPLLAAVTVKRPGGPEALVVPERHRAALKAAMGERARGPAIPNKEGGRMTKRSVQRAVRRAASWAGLERPVAPKDLRLACVRRGGPRRMAS